MTDHSNLLTLTRLYNDIQQRRQELAVAGLNFRCSIGFMPRSQSHGHLTAGPSQASYPAW